MLDFELYSLEQQQRNTSVSAGVERVCVPEFSHASTPTVGQDNEETAATNSRYSDPVFKGMAELAGIIGPGPTIINAQSDNERKQPRPYAEAVSSNPRIRVTGQAALDILEEGPCRHISSSG